MARSFPVGSFQGLRTGSNLLAGARDDGAQIEAALYEARARAGGTAPQGELPGVTVHADFLVNGKHAEGLVRDPRRRVVPSRRL